MATDSSMDLYHLIMQLLFPFFYPRHISLVSGMMTRIVVEIKVNIMNYVGGKSDRKGLNRLNSDLCLTHSGPIW